MINAQEARDLGTHESRLNAIIETFDKEIRKRAPGSRSRKLVLMFDLASVPDEQLVNDALTELRKNKFVAHAHRVEIDGHGRTKDMMEFTISWE